MVRLALLVRGVVFAMPWLVAATWLPAQDQPADILVLEEVRVEGIVAEVGSQGLLMRTQEGVEYIANASPKRVHNRIEIVNLPPPVVSVTGVGLPQHVTTGAHVDFEIILDADKRPTHVLPSLRIFTPSDKTILSCYGQLPEGGVNDAPMPFPKVGAGKWRVLGQIAGIRGNVLTVALRDGTLKIEVHNPPLVELDVSDHRYAKPGDRAVLHGFTPKLPMVFVTNLQITRPAEPELVPPQREPGEIGLGNPEGGNVAIPQLPPVDNAGGPVVAPPPKPSGVQVLKIN